MRAATPHVDDDAARATAELRVELGRRLDDSKRLEAVERAIQQLRINAEDARWQSSSALHG